MGVKILNLFLFFKAVTLFYPVVTSLEVAWPPERTGWVERSLAMCGQGSGFRVQGLGFALCRQGLGFRV
jgi:hypothetical protein